MSYDYSFDGKSLAALFAGSGLLFALVFVAGLLVGVGWGVPRKAEATATAATTQATGAPAAALPQQPVPAQPAAARAYAPAQEAPIVYEDPSAAAPVYASRDYREPSYAAREYDPYAPREARPLYDARQQGTAASPESAPRGQRTAPPAFDARREAARVDSAAIDPDPRLVSEAESAPAEPARARTDPAAYSVQVGAYSDEQDARRLASDLGGKGYATTIFAGRDAQARVWYAVRIGAYSSQREAAEAAGNFSAQEKIKAAVRPSGSL
ncbi:MAG TPA: SPOR domain-containing protein [Pyrinomonadaceae bacterium]|jgi:hypothetical protein|nr:SPOR domain-containing protein [Pyrinomonadaceae bacterium]